MEKCAVCWAATAVMFDTQGLLLCSACIQFIDVTRLVQALTTFPYTEVPGVNGSVRMMPRRQRQQTRSAIILASWETRRQRTRELWAQMPTGEQISRWRCERGLSSGELCRLTGVARKILREIEADTYARLKARRRVTEFLQKEWTWPDD